MVEILRMKERANRVVEFIRRKRGILIVSAILLASAVFGAAFWGKKADASDFITAQASRGTVEVTVSATGTVQAVTTVQVGSQTSGTIAWLGADFNSQVRRGQVIARLDPSTSEAQVQNAQASVMNAEAAVQAAATEVVNQEANVKAAKANQQVVRVQSKDAEALAGRYQELSNVIAGREIESAQSQRRESEHDAENCAHQRGGRQRDPERRGQFLEQDADRKSPGGQQPGMAE
jgi:HlyD family secretion protein